jgi:indolepyruvate ferredoxin oxidoreductase alpha subunit
MVKEAVNIKEFSAVIARHPCMLKFTREQRRKPGYQPRRVGIDQQKCRRLYECIRDFGCPTFTQMADGRIEINPDLCIGDGSCAQTCPSEAISTPKTV